MKAQITLNPTLNKMLHNLEHHIQENSFRGMCFAFIGGLLGKIPLLNATAPDVFDKSMQIVANIGIITGGLIGVLTLVLKCKEVYKEFFVKNKPPKSSQ